MAENDGKVPSAQAQWIESARAGIDDLSEEDRAAVCKRLEAGRSAIEAGKGVVLDDAYLSRLKDRALSRQ